MNKQKVIILLGVLVLIAVLIFSGVFFKGSAPQEVSAEEPIDIVLSFYDQRLAEVQSPDIDPYKSGLADTSILSNDLRSKIKNAEGYSGDELDPVLCQSRSDIKIAAREMLRQEDKVQIVVTARNEKLTGQAIVTLLKHNDGWFVDDISCSPGEFGPSREFSFEKQGFMLKDNIPSPYNPKSWHLVFEENGEQGHVVPLLFDASSVCVDQKGNAINCAGEQFIETTMVSIKGQMTELGVSVKRLEFIGK